MPSQTMYPVLRYADAVAAVEWLGRAFGFTEHAVYREDDGTIVHAELALEGGLIMLGQGEPKPQEVYVAVADPDAHYERAQAAGAEITREIEDTFYDSREYTARDVEGHVWSFGTYRPEAA